MDRKSIYSKTDDFIKGRWWSIVVVHIISAIIGAVIVGIFMQIFVGKIFVPLIQVLTLKLGMLLTKLKTILQQFLSW